MSRSWNIYEKQYFKGVMNDYAEKRLKWLRKIGDKSPVIGSLADAAFMAYYMPRDIWNMLRRVKLPKQPQICDTCKGDFDGHQGQDQPAAAGTGPAASPGQESPAAERSEVDGADDAGHQRSGAEHAAGHHEEAAEQEAGAEEEGH